MRFPIIILYLGPSSTYHNLILFRQLLTLAIRTSVVFRARSLVVFPLLHHFLPSPMKKTLLLALLLLGYVTAWAQNAGPLIQLSCLEPQQASRPARQHASRPAQGYSTYYDQSGYGI